jgi:hypothetical protein
MTTSIATVVRSQQQQQQQPPLSYNNHEHGSNIISKTPSRHDSAMKQHPPSQSQQQQPRRVLGDISNRKSLVTTQQQHVASTLFQQNYNNKQTPLSKINHTSSTFRTSSRTATKNTSDETRPSLRKTTHDKTITTTAASKSTILPQSTLQLHNVTTATTTAKRNNHNVTFILPDDVSRNNNNNRNTTIHSADIENVPTKTTSTIQTVPTTKVILPPNTKTRLPEIRASTYPPWFNNYEDETTIELPAGRLYHTQTYEEDDTTSVLSLEGAHTFRQECVQVLQEQHAYEWKIKDDYEQHCLRQLDVMSHFDIDSTDSFGMCVCVCTV